MPETPPPDHPLHIDVAALYEAVSIEKKLRGKEREHKQAVTRVAEVIRAARLAWESPRR